MRLEVHLIALAAFALTLSCSGGREEDPVATGALESGCEASDRTLYFHGTSGYGLEIVEPGICAPRIREFWSDDVAQLEAPSANLVVGYSKGRIPLLRRLDSGRATEKTALLLDPSWADGPRFDGKTGPAIVEAWLTANPERRFVLVYSPFSVGHAEYAALTRSPVASQIKVCTLAVQHLEVPRYASSQILLDLDQWLARRCES